MVAFNYFPSSVYREEHPEWVDYIIKSSQKHVDSILINKPELTTSKVVQTADIAHDSEFSFLVDYLLSTSYNILHGQGYNVENYDLIVSNLWFQSIKDSGCTNIHTHKNSQLSGWLFLETPENGSYPIFHDPRINKQMIELDVLDRETLSYSSSSVHFNNVLPGTVLISNSWLSHQLSPCLTQDKTSTIHFVISHKDKLCNTC
jgi:uncharacterized protein (TIGR02466 family)